MDPRTDLGAISLPTHELRPLGRPAHNRSSYGLRHPDYTLGEHAQLKRKFFFCVCGFRIHLKGFSRVRKGSKDDLFFI